VNTSAKDEKTQPGRGPNRSGTGAMERFVPAIGWLRGYDRSWLTFDLLAGLTLWGMVAPQAMAYAGIAGLPPEVGLYTLLASLLVYALFGTSRHLSVGPTSASAALVASTLVALGVSGSDPAAYAAAAAALVLVVGVIFLVAGFAKLGFITQFLSKPVMDGFVTALALFVGIGQLNKVFGVSKGVGNTVEKLWHVVTQISSANWVTAAVGLSALALLFVLPRISKKLPAGLLVLFGYIAVSRFADLSGRFGVATVGTLRQGLPAFTIPQVPFTTLMAMLLPALGIVLVAFSEALGAAQEFGQKHGYEVDADQELRAHGVANAASALFGGMIAAGGMGASAVNEGAGARSQVANLTAWVAVVLTVLFLTPLFASLPEAVLAALIIHAVWHLIVARKLAKIWVVSRPEWVLAALTFLGVTLLDVLPGMVIGMLSSVLLMLYKTSKPHVASLGRVPGIPGAYSDLKRHPENEAVDGVAIIRLDSSMYYANARTARDRVKEILTAMDPPARAVVLDAAGQDELDVTSAAVLGDLFAEWQKAGIVIFVAEAHTPVVDFARRTGLVDALGEDHFIRTLDAAVAAAEAALGR
jgi:sulfate permease, SulP family